ncbi:MAG: DUF2188 domain-containing protein [Polyangiaceae bacterium]|nr:DUF2188 domain-containing protein [Polyangiaceae bacterium]
MANEPMRYHVEPIEGGWKVTPGPDSQPESVHESKYEAIAAAEHCARKHTMAEVVVHRRDGTVEQQHSVGAEHRTG